MVYQGLYYDREFIKVMLRGRQGSSRHTQVAQVGGVVAAVLRKLERECEVGDTVRRVLWDHRCSLPSASARPGAVSTATRTPYIYIDHPNHTAIHIHIQIHITSVVMSIGRCGGYGLMGGLVSVSCAEKITIIPITLI